MGQYLVKILGRGRPPIDPRLRSFVDRFLQEQYAPQFAQTALAAAPEDTRTQEHYLVALVTECGESYDATRSPLQLNKAVSVLRLLRDADSRNIQVSAYSRWLGKLLASRYHDSENPEDLKEAITYFRESLALAERRKDRVETIKPLLLALCMKARIPGEENSLDEVINILKDPSYAIPLRAGDNGQFLVGVIRHMRDTLARNPEPKRLQAVLEIVKRESARCCNRIDCLSEHSLLLLVLATWYEKMYKRNHDLTYLEEAIRVGFEKLKVSMKFLPDTERVASAHADLRCQFLLKYERTFEEEYLTNAMFHGHQALQAISEHHINRSAFLTNYAALWGLKYQRSRDPAHLQSALDILDAAGAATPVQHYNRATYLVVHANRLQTRYEDFGAEADLQRAISMARAALIIDPDQALCLNNLANMLGLRHELRGAPDDLEEAISKANEAVEATPESDPKRAAYLSTLARWLSQKASLSSALEDLDRAIDTARTTIGPTIDMYNLQYLYKNTLATLLGAKYRLTEDPHFLREALDIAETVMEEAVADHPSRPLFLATLSALVRDAMKAGGGRHDFLEEAELDKSISLARAALNASPPHNINRPLFMARLAELLESKYKMTGRFEIITEALDLGHMALKEMPPDHQHIAYLQLTLATRLELNGINRIWIGGVRVWPDEQTLICLDIFNSTGSLPLYRIRAGWLAGRSYASVGGWSEASDILDETVRLFPLLSPRWLARDDQQHVLKDFSGLSALAATAALRANRSDEHAIEILEAGRGVMAGLIMDARSDLSDLAKKHSEIADKYRWLRDRVSSGTLGSFSASPSVNAAFDAAAQSGHYLETTSSPVRYTIDDRRADVEKLHRLEEDIRNLAGFETFQRALTPTEVVSLAGEGVIVCFNVTEYGSHALVINKHGIKSLPLPQLQYGELEAKAKLIVGDQKLSKGSWQTEAEDNGKLREILVWLWDVAICHVLDFLHLRDATGSEDRPRIWWVANGQVGLMPLHAAGDYAEDGACDECTSVFAISSYTPTIKALRFSQDRPVKNLAADGQTFLIVAMPETAGQVDLNADREAYLIEQSIEPIRAILPPRPTKSVVMQELPTSTVVHFTCHGISDAQEPSRSALVLCHPEDNDKCEHLTIRELATITHERAQIAYLSACSTAENASESLMDEVIHIASAFQLIGFPHVIGALWEATDGTATELARLFYRILMDKMTGTWDGNVKIISESLDEAVEVIREENAANFLAWAPFIHLGA
jgi:tetratricopeptide (TPR) repeat protein